MATKKWEVPINDCPICGCSVITLDVIPVEDEKFWLAKCYDCGLELAHPEYNTLIRNWNKIQKTKESESSGGSCNYYKVQIENPTTHDAPYIAECNDVIEALEMTFAESNMFKEIWRTAAARTLGKKKAGHTAKRGAEKILFFAKRHAVKYGVEE